MTVVLSLVLYIAVLQVPEMRWSSLARTCQVIARLGGEEKKRKKGEREWRMKKTNEIKEEKNSLRIAFVAASEPSKQKGSSTGYQCDGRGRHPTVTVPLCSPGGPSGVARRGLRWLALAPLAVPIGRSVAGRWVFPP